VSSSSSISDCDGDSEFLNVSGQATGRVVEEINRSIKSATSSTTVSIARNKTFIGFPSSDDSPDIETKQQAEMAEENWSLKRGYEWVDYRVRKYFSCYRWFSALCSLLSNIFVYYPEATEEIIYFWRCAIDNVCHGRENETCEFLLFL